MDEVMNLWKGSRQFSPSTVVLIAANLIPLFGIFVWGWSAFNVVALYWMENVIIGLITILKMVTCAPDEEGRKAMGKSLQNFVQKRLAQQARGRGAVQNTTAISSGAVSEEEQERVWEEQLGEFGSKAKGGRLASHVSKLFVIPFFTVHYGMFCLVHGVFVVVLLSGDGPLSGGGSTVGDPFSAGFGLVEQVIGNGGYWFVIALVVSHLFSFFVNYIGKGEYRRTVVPLLMFSPYPRIVVLHIAILVGAFAIMALGSSLFLVALLVVGKIILDLALHLRAHSKLEPGEKPVTTLV